MPDTHYCFTAGKDKTVKYWDLDRRGEVAALEGHAAEVWALGLSSDGSLLVSAGADRGLRVWERTEEPIFLEEERERRLESLFESQLEVGSEPSPFSPPFWLHNKCIINASCIIHAS